MGFKEFTQSAKRLLRTLTRPDWNTYWQSTKIVFLGIAVLGGIGYLIRILAVTLRP
ncbi:MAG: protein translocase SEC61 complex subunit gamma [Deltaproteobacteria bacterium]|nr:protein translocase SEC61 complex subunit gamma [Deltaproteobacteria bacterium]